MGLDLVTSPGPGCSSPDQANPAGFGVNFDFNFVTFR